MRLLNIRLAIVCIVVFNGAMGLGAQNEPVNVRWSSRGIKMDQKQQLDGDIKNLYSELQDYIVQLQNNFVKILENKIDALKDFSKKASQDLFNFFDEQVEGNEDQAVDIVSFRSWIQEKRDYDDWRSYLLF